MVISIAVSPFDDLVLIASGFGDAVFTAAYDAQLQPPFVLGGELTYSGAGPQLPGNFVQLTRGNLDGNAYLAELSGIRRIRFDGGGTATDFGVFSRGGGTENVIGAFGFPP